MLRALRIKDLAIIDELNLEFTEGFAVFTGETGAGKSIIVDALDLLTGGRGSADVIRDSCDEAIVEGVFYSEVPEQNQYKLKLNKYGIEDNGQELLVRRCISRSGRNRLYINGVLSTLSVLSDLCSQLIDIHGQHEHQSLLNKETHVNYLDAFGKLTELRGRFAERFRTLDDLQRRLSMLEDNIIRKKEREDLIRFQQAEIKTASLRIGEDTDLAAERNILDNSQNLSALSHDAYCILYENDESVLALLSRAERLLSDISCIDQGMTGTAELVRTSRVNIKEASEGIRRFLDRIRHDPERLERVNERIYLIDKMKKKYGPAIEDILSLQERLERDLKSIESIDHDVSLITEEIGIVRKDVCALADELSEKRKDAAGRFEKEVMSELSSLAMEKTGFVINIEDTPLSQDGVDSVEFMIANMNEGPRQLTRVASGGELSRILLAIKSRIHSINCAQTLIFDEVDAGIGGRVAEEVGKRLKSLSGGNQLFCVTHLPQIAAFADSHFHVEKVVAGERAVTRVRLLDREERIEEISRMLGGSEKTGTALRYAEEMINRVTDGNEPGPAKNRICSQH
ncbi:MAG: DNA repair protein RecN [Nitrospirae bacterium]|nr:DNA repair protein RecN [Nitrospirota bacterium]